MKIYLVGGAVRDALLDLPIKEKDWVVVGATPEELLAAGFRSVGKDFPVFLHPETQEEYALARTERKISKGYTGFIFYTESNVTLEEDLKRRDLTINAMARTETGKIIDPYGGQNDLFAKRLRHVSLAFAEDPVRILRVARFAAKLPDFSVDPETNELMRELVEKGEIDALVAERVWQELNRALNEKKPIRFFEVLANCDALTTLFPTLNLNDPGIDALSHSSTPLFSAPIRFAALMHAQELNVLKKLVQRYRIPKEFSELAELTCQYLKNYQDILNCNAKEILYFLKKTDAIRRLNRFQNFLKTCHVCFDDKENSTRDDRIEKAISAIKKIDVAAIQNRHQTGKEFIEALEAEQIAAIDSVLH